VLLIEDDPLIRGLIAEALRDEGLEVDGLASAEDALILLGAGQVPAAAGGATAIFPLCTSRPT
jgi:DNA-binding response OmpR family regulator